jgi:hypothetical protein
MEKLGKGNLFIVNDNKVQMRNQVIDDNESLNDKSPKSTSIKIKN